jgi:hypothetical protein
MRINILSLARTQGPHGRCGPAPLLNRRYFSSTAQWDNTDESYVLAPGASAVLSYTLCW